MMKKYLYIGFGGFIGAICRYVVKVLYSNQYEGIQWGTLFVNISGCFLLAFILTIAFDRVTFNTDIRNALTIGLLGAYTTFSGFCNETINLMSLKLYYSAILYSVLSIILGIGAIYLGYIFAQYVVLKLISKSLNDVSGDEAMKLDIEVD